jgi:hypothetical protein
MYPSHLTTTDELHDIICTRVEEGQRHSTVPRNVITLIVRFVITATSMIILSAFIFSWFTRQPNQQQTPFYQSSDLLSSSHLKMGRMLEVLLNNHDEEDCIGALDKHVFKAHMVIRSNSLIPFYPLSFQHYINFNITQLTSRPHNSIIVKEVLPTCSGQKHDLMIQSKRRSKGVRVTYLDLDTLLEVNETVEGKTALCLQHYHERLQHYIQCEIK